MRPGYRLVALSSIKRIRQQLAELERLLLSDTPTDTPISILTEQVAQEAAAWQQPIPAAAFYRHMRQLQPQHTKHEVAAVLLQLGYRRKRSERGVTWLQ